MSGGSEMKPILHLTSAGAERPGRLRKEAAQDPRKGSRSETKGKASKAKGKVASKQRRTEHLKAALEEVRRLLAERGIPLEGTADQGFVTNKLAAYHDLIARIRDAVKTSLPADATVAVVNKGDCELLKLDGRTAWHFPRNADGSYSGHHPSTSAEAIEQLDAARSLGAKYLLFPGTAFWWLDFYGDFRAHLETQYHRIADVEDTCVIFALDQRRAPQSTEHAREKRAASEGAARMDDDDTELRMALARALTRLGREKDARRTLNEGLQTHPGDARLHVALMQLAMSFGKKADALQHGAKALALAPDDYATNLAIARTASQLQRLDVVEERLVHLVTIFPSNGVALNELMNLYCARLDGKDCDAAVLDRLMARLKASATSGRIAPETHLRIAETLGNRQKSEAALQSLGSALERLDFSSEVLQGFVARLLRSLVSDKSAIPFSDKLSLAAFLTHAGNGFAAVRDPFRARTCHHLAIAADAKSWNSASWAARFNLAFDGMARGSVTEALHHLAKATRLYPDETARIAWPSQDGVVWPHARFDLSAAFGKLKPAGAAWPKITVITPSFNQAEYVEETLLSVLHQHYPNLEYIVIDGESTDGSVEVLRRYEPRLTKLVVEPDEGQSDALNKGLHMATGDILLWVNSDDLLGPGSLFLIALAWIEEKADVIAGFCCEHSEGRFGLINLPQASQATFNPECLGDIFQYWLKGHYFYQPEVAFSRRIFEKAGGSLDKSLHLAMDYDFWMRCAAAGARLSVVHWPVGLFRKHDKQKTSRLDDTVIEQATVRDRFVIPEPGFERRLQIRRRLSGAFSGAMPTVSVVSTRASKIFSADTGRELAEELAAEGVRVNWHADATGIQPRRTDLVILLMHLYREHEALRKLREGGYDGAVAGWFWDNHHHVFDNHAAAADLDVCIPGHGFAADYLRSRRYISATPVPLCVTQWSAAEARKFFARHGGSQRTNTLYGGFVRYAFATKRNRLLGDLIGRGMEGVYFLEEDALERYFGLSLPDRFKAWCSHKVSICLPLSGDLSQRFFDALLTGQVPIVPDDIHDLDQVIPRELQESLPVVRFSEYTAAAVREAHAKAVSLFDRDGEAGVIRRHRFALDHHTFLSRIRGIVSSMRGLAQGGLQDDRR